MFFHSTSQPQLHSHSAMPRQSHASGEGIHQQQQYVHHQISNQQQQQTSGMNFIESPTHFGTVEQQHQQMQSQQQQFQFPHDQIGLINQLVVGQQQPDHHLIRQNAHHTKKDPTTSTSKAVTMMMGNSGSSSSTSAQRIPSAASTLSSRSASSGNGTEPELESPPQQQPLSRAVSPSTSAQLFLLAKNQQQLQQQLSSQQQQQTAALNSGILGGLDFSNLSQLASYAGHFPEQMFGSSTTQGGISVSVSAPASSQFAYQQRHQSANAQQNDTATSSIASNNGPIQQNSLQQSSSSIAPNPGVRRHRTNGNSLKCLYCPKRIPRGETAWQAHLEDCRMIRIHECSQCGKRFKTRGGLQQHNRIHINDRPYHCHYCAKRFTQKSHLDQHERIHTGQKPFICQYCGRAFRQRSQQMGHEATHVNRERHAAAMAGGAVNSGIVFGQQIATGLIGTRNTSVSSEQSSQNSPPVNRPTNDLMTSCAGMSSSSSINQGQQNAVVANNNNDINGSFSLADQQQQQMAFDGLLRAVEMSSIKQQPQHRSYN